MEALFEMMFDSMAFKWSSRLYYNWKTCFSLSL